jgi:phage baseplate assembly protein V
MALDRDMLAQLQKLLRPLATRVANTVARAVVQLVVDDTKLQLLQVGVLAGETLDNAEHHQPYGFSSVPLTGAEAVVVFPNGDRSHPLVVTVSDRRYRPTGGAPGEVTVYNDAGARVALLDDGTVEARSDAGVAVPLATKADLDNLKAAISGAVIVANDGGASLQSTILAALEAWPVGTSVLKGE